MAEIRDWLAAGKRFFSIHWLFGPKFYEKPEWLEIGETEWDETKPFGGVVVDSVVVTMPRKPELRGKLTVELADGTTKEIAMVEYDGGWIAEEPVPAGGRVIGTPELYI